ncbi:MAG: nucleoside kinase [Clostridiales bacterium]
MRKETTIHISVNGIPHDFHYGIILEEILENFPNQKIPIIAAYVNGYVQGLDYALIASCEIRWIDIQSPIGIRIYRHSQRLLLLSAHNNVLPHRDLHIRHSLGSGTFCQSRGLEPLTPQELTALKLEMQSLIDKKAPILKVPIFCEDAIYFYKQRGQFLQAELLEASSQHTMFFYEIDKTVEAFDGQLATNCSQLRLFDLTFFEDGFILSAPTADNPTKLTKFNGMSRIGTLFNQHDHWVEALEIAKIGELNRVIEKGKISQIIEMAESLQLQNTLKVVGDINKDIENNRLLLIAGPSSSGKTTLSHRLSIFFRINGIEPLTIAMDDYFLNRDKTPKDENGELDFEDINALDLELFDHDLAELIDGKTVETPIFDFNRGMRSEKTRTMKMNPQQILIVEGMHCLNHRIAHNVKTKNKKRIYISALTQLNLDQYNPISSTDNRLLRRMTRDMQFRNTTPDETMKRWESVQRGEDKNIFPYQENADYFINTALIYELAVLKPFIAPKLGQITTKNKYYHEAKRLLGILDFIKPVDATVVPPGSLLREFIGGSPFSDD